MQRMTIFFKKLCLYLLIIVLYIHLSLEIELSEELSTFQKTFSKSTHRAQISLRLFQHLPGRSTHNDLEFSEKPLY